MKTEVYSWRLSADTKSMLEREARRQKKTLAGVLHQAVEEWLKKIESPEDNAEEQARLQRAASECMAVFAGGDSHRSEKAKLEIRKRLRRKNAR